MDILLAHSAKDGASAQSYEEHVRGVSTKAARYTKEAEHYAANRSGILSAIVEKSALLHDLGKLDEQNQKVLRSLDGKQHHLPVNHVDAGSAALKAENCLYSALMVYAHHRGLPDMEAEFQRETAIFRDERSAARTHTDATLEKLLREHQEIFPYQTNKAEQPYNGDQDVFFRMALSCLADADHTDTAAVYGQAPEREYLTTLCERAARCAGSVCK